MASVLKRMRHFVVLLLLFSSPARAEIEKLAKACGQQMCFYWWPKLPLVDGWHHDRDHSYVYGVNALAPNGHTFANAEYVIYARAVYKPRVPEVKSLAMFIQNDQKDFTSRDPNIVVTKTDHLRTGDGQILESYTFFPKAQGNWERVSYGEEGDFYLVFAVSSRTESGYTAVVPSYKEIVNAYKAKP